VCTIEILSLTNKTPGEKGQELYRQKQSEILESNTHLIEIDLLRAGIHTTAVALDRALAETGKFDYHVCVRRFNRFEDFEVYPILMQQSLPSVAVPLMPGDSDVEVDLQAVFERTYDAGPFARAIDYRTDPVEPPLTPEQKNGCATFSAARECQESNGPERRTIMLHAGRNEISGHWNTSLKRKF